MPSDGETHVMFPNMSCFDRPVWRRAALITLLCGGLWGCAAQTAYRDAREMLARDQAGAALAKLEEATRLDPTSPVYRVEYLRTRERVTAELLSQAEQARVARQFDVSEAGYRRVLALQPASEQAIAGIKLLERERRWESSLVQARASAERKDPEGARARIRSVLLENPTHAEARRALADLERAAPRQPVTSALAASYKKPVSLEFKDVSIKTVFELLSKSSGLNFLFDKDVRTDQKTSIYLRNSSVEAAVSRVLMTNQLEQRVLDEHTVLIYPDTPAKQKDYQLLTVKSFYLSNAEAKVVAATLKSLLKAKDVVVDERLNLVILRDTPEVIRLADKLVALQDVSEPEVMLDVEIVEVKRSRLLDLGVRWPDQISFAPLAASTGGQLTVNDLRRLDGSRVGVTVSPLTISAIKTDTDANILANPRIRTKNKEKARILIGDRVPNITTTSTSSGFISDSVNYIDVGLKLEVEPTIYPDGYVAIRLALEVGSLVSQVQTKSGTLAYQIGTRNVSTMLRLKDGENQVLAGLINDEDRRTANKLPGLGDIPIAGRLFGGQADDSVKTEIILSITPRILRHSERPDATMLEFESGTESGLKGRGGEAAPVAAEPAAPSRSTPPAPVPSLGAGAAPPATTSDAVAANAAAQPPSQSGAPAPNAVATDADLRLLGPLQVRAGQAFSVDLMVEPRKNIVTLPLAFGFDPTALQVVSVTEGELMKQGGAITQLESRVDAGGQVLVTIGRAGNVGASAAAKALTLNLRALSTSRTTTLQVLTVAPQGEGGGALNVTLPTPLQVAITP
jgi:general secretion pathway protein D